MNSIYTIVTLLLAILCMSSKSYSGDKFSALKGPYLGQKPPGSRPEIFAPGIVNTKAFKEIEGTFAPGMNAFYFIRVKQEGKALTVIEYKNNQWQESLIKSDVSELSISPDGDTIYLQNKYIERVGNDWSDLKSLAEPLKDILIMRTSVATSGTHYFDTYSENLDIPLRYSRLQDDKYEEPKLLGPQFSVGNYNAHPFIAPDESYIIWDSIRESGYGSSDLYISFRTKDGAWGPAINMGEKINTADAENYPSVTPDGKYLFFDRRAKGRSNKEVDIYWVDAQIINDLRPE
ncbi:TolB family protein [Agarilytica rhodophyticola]|uniref:TolB family protein n=1 Tax=Agarilytica rhodophyticola TaxID=1737490 RepID=UPI000CD961ED|nr:PD40 domain-containing protein [Agarilytica rhodophyticola]